MSRKNIFIKLLKINVFEHFDFFTFFFLLNKKKIFYLM